jgi:sec-independent protein translocase protein TatC
MSQTAPTEPTQNQLILTQSTADETLAALPITEHLIELRRRLIRVFGLVIALFMLMLPFANDLYEVLSMPLRGRLPANATMVATDVTATFMAPFKLNFYLALIIAMPYILYQLWKFLAPALYQKEQKVALPILLSSILLFYIGIAFAYFIALPSILGFFIHAAPDSVAPMTEINSYLNFCLKLFLVFGATFEIPVVTLMLILGRFVSIDSLVEKRRYIVVGCFFISMLVTPPDGLSMLLLAVPMWLLFEMGLLLGRILLKRSAQNQQDLAPQS